MGVHSHGLGSHIGLIYPAGKLILATPGSCPRLFKEGSSENCLRSPARYHIPHNGLGYSPYKNSLKVKEIITENLMTSDEADWLVRLVGNA